MTQTATKVVCNASPLDVYVVETVGGVEQSYGPIPPGGSLTVPLSDADVAQAQTDAAAAASEAAAYQAAPATAADHAAASHALISEKLASIPVTREALPTILEALLGEAAAAIPFFETYALDPAMNSPQWTAFQALNQTTKDRLLFDALRALAGALRYLTGELPTS